MIGKGFRQDNTWLAIDPIVGCGLDCQYCFLQAYGKAKTKGKVIMLPKETLERLVTFRTYRKDSVLMLGSETDIFMNRFNSQFFAELLRLFEYERIGNPIAVVTKCHIPDEFIQMAQDFKHTTILFYLSYSGLPKEIEPNVNIEKLKNNFRRLHDAGLNAIHYWRPLLPQNSSLEIMETVFRDVYRYAKCSVISGLRTNSRLREFYWFWPELKKVDIAFHKVSYIWTQIVIESIEIIKSKYPNYPIYHVNSCAVAYTLGKPEFNCFYDTELCKDNSCPSSQRGICQVDSVTRWFPTEEQIRLAMRSLSIDGNFIADDKEKTIVVDGVVEHGDLVY
ncbi:MAG: radical SAM protein, partial [Planctomycetes bacterium]|nr:radical SAM protein [Planctomycetota bacterium]